MVLGMWCIMVWIVSFTHYKLYLEVNLSCILYWEWINIVFYIPVTTLGEPENDKKLLLMLSSSQLQMRGGDFVSGQFFRNTRNPSPELQCIKLQALKPPMDRKVGCRCFVSVIFWLFCLEMLDQVPWTNMRLKHTRWCCYPNSNHALETVLE